MTRTIHVCDRCGKVVDWCYPMPNLVIEGLRIAFYSDPDNEMCEDCARDVISEYHRLAHEKVTDK